MGEVAKWLVQVSWMDLAVGVMAGLAAAGLLTVLVMSLGRSNRDGDGRSDDVPQEQQRLLLFCGDARALADLAVQRHMSDLAFFQRFQSQPCYQALSPHFSEQFREHLAQPGRQSGRSDLASACRQECERLEREWRIR
jgi:hypothetical protein